MKVQRSLQRKWQSLIAPLLLCALFFLAYTTLSVIRHLHYGSFGYDLGINDQAIWEYSHFKPPISTIGPIPFESKLAYHIELSYAVIAPFYWIWSSPYMLLILQAAVTCFSGIPLFLLARKYKFRPLLQYALLLTYLMYYGVQNALWFDFHSTPFGAAFLAWFLYFLDTNQLWPTLITFVLALTSKEDVPLVTLGLGLVYLYKTRRRINLVLIGISVAYLLFIFFVYFPHLTTNGYLYQRADGLLSSLNPIQLFDTPDKREVLFYTFAGVGFIPLLSPVYLIPYFLRHYALFVLSDNPALQTIFMQYRIISAPLMVWATIWTIKKVKRLNNTYVALYLILCTLVIQYVLHLPLSYLGKGWFWREPASVTDINSILPALPKNASVVAQNNIVPHISERDAIFTLWPEQKTFDIDSPCDEKTCDWFRWSGNPSYLVVDTSSDWDTRHFLTDREHFIKGITNLENAGIIEKDKQHDTAVLYKVLKHP